MSIRDLQTKTVELSVGLTIVISQSNWRISRKKDHLENQAKDNPLPDPDDQMFAENFYPMLASCVISDNCPTVDDCLTSIPEDDLDKWYKAVRELNPSWFTYLDAVSDLINQQENADTETKKELTRNLIGGEQKGNESTTG